MKIQISFPTDDDGYFDRECPFEGCLREFKVHADDWQSKVADDKAFCPWCRHEAPSDKWFTTAQVEHMTMVAERHMMKYLVGKMKRMADDFNRSQRRGSLISMRLDMTAPTLSRMIPCEVARIMEQRFECSGCGCRFASVGASFFCPACGLDSAPGAFRSTIETVRRSVTDAVAILDRNLDRDAASDLGRVIIENGLVRLVSAHQRHADALFSTAYGSTVKIPKNVFQRLAEASVMWKNQTGLGYEDLLTTTEIERLRLFFQRRHLLEHRDGIVDAEYVSRSGDTRWSAGQRLVITPDDVIELAALVQKLADGIETKLCTPPAP